MKETLIGLKMGSDIAVFALLGVLLCVVSTSVADESVCLTEGCKHIAKTYQKNMDRSVDPCDNFYKFACGGFLKSDKVPGPDGFVNFFTLIRDELSEQLRKSLELPIQPNEPKHFRLVKNFYKACMNEDKIESQGLTPIREVLKNLGGWPVVSDDVSPLYDFDWKSSIYKVQDAGYDSDYLISIFVFQDLNITSKRSIYINQPSFGLSHEYLLRDFYDENVQKYYRYMVDIAVKLGAKKSRAMTELKHVLLFEMRLANISMSPAMQANLTLYYNPMTLTALEKKFPTIPWKEYFDKLLPSSAAISKDEVVVVGDPNYIASFEKLMERTLNRTQANYVMWRIVAQSVPLLNSDIRKIEIEYNSAINGETERKPRWKQCVDLVPKPLSLSVSALYVKNYFKKDAKKNVVNITEDIKNKVVERLKQVDWMDDDTRESALEKLDKMTSIVGYSDEILEDNRLEKYYENLELSEENYFENNLNCTLFGNEKSFGRLREPVEKNDYTEAKSAVVDAYYSFLDNSILLPAGILQDLFFSDDRPKYTNYGAMGVFVAGQMTHGFGNVGRLFDKNGKMADWWTDTTEKNFQQRSKCIIDQYGNYTVEEIGLKLNGERILNNVMADNGGVKLAYSAYIDWADKNPSEERLPDLDYSPRKMFWISLANPWCTKYTSETLKNLVETNDHSPAEFRIVGPLSNMAEFSKDFDCPSGSKMNPIEKCSVW